MKTETAHQGGKFACEGLACLSATTKIVDLAGLISAERTKEAVDEEGWFHSGDIGVFRKDLSLKIIDRKKNIFKLQQGEYLAPEKIENVYKRASGIDDIFIHGDSL